MKAAKVSKLCKLRVQDDYAGMTPEQIAALEQEVQTFAKWAAQRLGRNSAWQIGELNQPGQRSDASDDH